MLITLTPAQWAAIVPLIKVGKRAELALGLPIDLNNGDQLIEITADEVKITLTDQ